MEKSFIVSSSPHIRDNASTRQIMLDVIIALIPASLAGVYFFGPRTLMVILVSVLACVLSEYASRKLMKRSNTILDLSAVVTGLLLALNLPPTAPLWMVVIGAVVAVVVIKQLFGGLGQNFINPALGARVFLFISYAGHMTNWVIPGADGVSSATPLGLLKAEEAAEIVFPSYKDLFLGNIGGCIGEVSAAALLIGGVYLVAKKGYRPGNTFGIYRNLGIVYMDIWRSDVLCRRLSIPYTFRRSDAGRNLYGYGLCNFAYDH